MRTLIFSFLFLCCCTLAYADGIGTPCSVSTDCSMQTTDGQPCPPDQTVFCTLVCPVCGAGNTCAVVGDDPNNPGHALSQCAGPQCGNGNVVCDATQVCDYAADCITACCDASEQIINDGLPPPPLTCDAEGEFAAKDGTCFVPGQYRLCKAIGGHICGMTPAAKSSSTVSPDAWYPGIIHQ